MPTPRPVRHCLTCGKDISEYNRQAKTCGAYRCQKAAQRKLSSGKKVDIGNRVQVPRVSKDRPPPPVQVTDGIDAGFSAVADGNLDTRSPREHRLETENAELMREIRRLSAKVDRLGADAKRGRENAAKLTAAYREISRLKAEAPTRTFLDVLNAELKADGRHSKADVLRELLRTRADRDRYAALYEGALAAVAEAKKEVTAARKREYAVVRGQRGRP